MEKERSKLLIVLGSRIRDLRKAKGLSLRQMAWAMDKDHQSLARLELGRVNPGYLFLLEVCEAMGVELAELLTEVPSWEA